ncbi:MAG TPA: TldD/PmbA family protein [Acidimicrobiales bacterium]|nr:TldD/PmbA family protein [Acidimicrobiales bacterium]
MSELLDIANRIIGWADAGEDVEAYVVHRRDTDIKVYEGAIEELASAESDGVGIRVVSDHREGFAYTGSLDEEILRETLQEARDNASFASREDWVALPQPDGVSPADVDLWRDSLASVPTERKVEMALELDRMVRARDPRIRNVESSQYGDQLGERAVASTTGISSYDRSTACYLVTIPIAGEGDDSHIAAGYSVGREVDDLDLEAAVAMGVEDATILIGATKPTSTRLPVVFDRRVASSIISIIASTLDGDAVLKGRSLFAKRLGEEIAGPGIQLTEDPRETRAINAARHDAEGLACRPVELIRDGVLQTFLHNSESARRTGVASTASAARADFKSKPGISMRAVSLAPGDMDEAAIIAAVGNGLFVKNIIGTNSGVNRISGDISVGAEGLMIRNGQLAEPVRECTIATTIQRLLKEILHVGNDTEWLVSSSAGVTLAVDGIALSGL